MEVTYLMNSGLLIEAGGKKMIIDALSGNTEYFDKMPKKLVTEITKGKGIFENLNAMLFTHDHVDHFNEETANLCRKNNDLEWVFIPEEEETCPSFVEKNLEDVQIFCLKIPHSGKEFRNVKHYAFLIRHEGDSIYVSGDSELQEPTQISMLGGVPVTKAFFNGFHLQFEKGRKIIEGIKAETTYIYHIPLKKDDKHGIRKAVIANQKKYKNLQANCVLLLENMVKV
ncbi:MAG: MBL fold metallo-hydrolase [Anaerovorax sp.]